MTVRVLAILGVGLAAIDTPVVRADDLGLTRGDGCFEGCRVRTSRAGSSSVDKLGAHLDRLARSAAALGIAFDRDAWCDLIAQATAALTEPGETAMKLVLTRGPGDGAPPTGLLTISPLPPDYPRQRREGLRVITLSRGIAEDAFAAAPWLLGGVKTLSYAVNMAAQREAGRRGADDAILLTAAGMVLEAPTGSVVWSVGRTLHTIAPGPSGILAGTTQQLLFERARSAGWATELGAATAAELHAADVVWLVGSVRGPVDVVLLDGVARRRNPTVDAEIRGLAGF